MAPVKDKVVKQVQQVLYHRPKPSGGSTTFAAAANAGATSISATANTGWANGDTLKLGRGNESELNRINGSITGSGPYTFPLQFPTTYAHAIGDPIVEYSSYDIGDIEGGGVSVRASGETQDVIVATKRTQYTIIQGYSRLTLEFRLPNASLHGLVHATGMLLGALTGSGTTADPYVVATDGNNFNAETDVCITAVVVLMDGSIACVEYWSVDLDYTGIDFQFTTGQNTSIPVVAVASAGGVAYTGAPVYAVDSSILPTKDQVFGGLTEVGIFTIDPSSYSSTVATAAVAAGSKVVEVASTSGAAGGNVMKLNAGDRSEYHEVNTVSSPNLNFRTPMYRGMPIGTAVVRYVRTVFAGVAPDGVRFTVGGSGEDIRIGTSRMAVGWKPGNVLLSFALAMIDITLDNLAKGLMIDAALIANGRLPITKDTFAKKSIDGAYLKGLLQNGDTFEIRVWGCTQEITDFLLNLAYQGVSSIPIRFRPTSGAQFLRYA